MAPHVTTPVRTPKSPALITTLPVEEKPAFLTMPEVAFHCRKSERTIKRWVKEGVLPYHRFGHAVLFRMDEILTHEVVKPKVGRPRRTR